MNWTLILLFSLFGGIMGILSVRGYTQKIEPFLWLLFGIITALVVSKNIEEKTFIHALFIGISWGILNGMIQSAFFDQYIASNPNLAENYKKIGNMKPQLFVLVGGIVMGIVTGLALGGLSLLLKKLW